MLKLPTDITEAHRDLQQEPEQDSTIHNSIAQQQGKKKYLFCKRCDNARQELLYIEGNLVYLLCLGCGIITSFTLDNKPAIKERFKRNKKGQPSYV